MNFFFFSNLSVTYAGLKAISARDFGDKQSQSIQQSINHWNGSIKNLRRLIDAKIVAKLTAKE